MTARIMEMRTHLGGNLWPAVPSQSGALLSSMLYQLEQSQWWSAQQLLEHQLLQLAQLLKHAYETVPYYRQRLDAAGFKPEHQLTIDNWRELPLLTRRDVQSAGDTLVSRAIPKQHGSVSEVRTSGSTGEPVKVLCTEVDLLLWEAMVLREHRWHGRDLSRKLATIRVLHHDGAPPLGTMMDDWGPPTNKLYVTGPLAALNMTADVATQVDWLMRQQPDYLLTYPTNLSELIAAFSKRGRRPQWLREVRTVGEAVSAELRAACRDSWGVPLTDVYSARELGYIAIQCPVSGQYHVMSEGVLVEILDEDGRPCRAGEVGRLVVTKLHNFATPLIRYELRDYAEAGEPCPCGRGLQTLVRILGRSRNMVTLPTGERRWPMTGSYRFREVAPIRQCLLVQHTLQDIEVRLVLEHPLSMDKETRLTQVIHDGLGYPFKLKFVYFSDEIPRGAGGKFEDFVSELEK